MFISERTNLTWDQRGELTRLLGYDANLSDGPLTYEEAMAKVQELIKLPNHGAPYTRPPRWFDESLSCSVVEDDD